MRNKFAPNRRAVILGLASSAVLVPGVSFAITEAQARALIGKVVDEVNAIINSGKPETAMYADFEALFAKYGDVPIIARSSLGVAWRSATSNQQTAYVAAFRSYMASKYGAQFHKFKDGKIEVTGAKSYQKGYLVNSMAYLKGSAPFTVDWQVSDQSGQDKMFNLYIEGISLLATERTEIAAMLDRRGGNLDLLIKDLKTAN